MTIPRNLEVINNSKPTYAIPRVQSEFCPRALTVTFNYIESPDDKGLEVVIRHLKTVSNKEEGGGFFHTYIVDEYQPSPTHWWFRYMPLPGHCICVQDDSDNPSMELMSLQRYYDQEFFGRCLEGIKSMGGGN